MKKLSTMVLDAAKVRNVPVTICGLAVGNPANTVQYLQPVSYTHLDVYKRQERRR